MEIPASVKCIDTRAFYKCKNLKRVVFTDESQLETIGNECFRSSGIEEITLPSKLKEIGDGAFYRCNNLKIYMKDGCEASFVGARVSDLTCIIPLSTALVGGIGI